MFDLLITDMEEALRLSGTSKVEEAVLFFQNSGVGAFIITHGSNQLYLSADNLLFGQIQPTTLPVSERVVTELKQMTEKSGDTTGCGDNFVGGVLAAIARQLIKNPSAQVDFKSAVALGIVSGGYACFYNGGTFYESFPGQKSSLIKTYHQDYLLQIGQTDKI